MSEPQSPGCPYPQADQAADGCPAGPGSGAPAGWDLEAHIEAMRRAKAAAESSHLSEERAQQMATRVAEQRAAVRGMDSIQSEFVEALGKKLGYGHPLSQRTGLPKCEWTPEAEARLQEVPAFCRELTRWRVEWTAIKHNLGTTITPEVMEVKYDMWGKVSHAIQERQRDALPWTDSARERFQRVPEFVRGQVLEAVEGNARQLGCSEVDDQVVDRVIQRWSETGDFHEGLYGFK